VLLSSWESARGRLARRSLCRPSRSWRRRVLAGVQLTIGPKQKNDGRRSSVLVRNDSIPSVRDLAAVRRPLREGLRKSALVSASLLVLSNGSTEPAGAAETPARPRNEQSVRPAVYWCLASTRRKAGLRSTAAIATSESIGGPASDCHEGSHPLRQDARFALKPGADSATPFAVSARRCKRFRCLQRHRLQARGGQSTSGRSRVPLCCSGTVPAVWLANQPTTASSLLRPRRPPRS